MTTKHTPGPWVASDPNLDNAGFVDSTDGTPICEMTSTFEDATLVAAAPDLYDACAEFVRKVEVGEARSTRSYAQMKAALEKAAGGPE